MAINHSKNTQVVFRFILIIVSLLFVKNSLGQDIKELGIGDKLPDIEIGNILNQSHDNVKLRDLYKDGLLVINFWATWCSPCLKEMTVLDSVKSNNPDNFNVLSVTYQSKETISQFMSNERNKDIRSSNLLVATNDTLLREYFPHKFIPHNIWIDSVGVIRAITAGDMISEENILNFYERVSELSINQKDDNMEFNPLEVFHLGDSIFKYRSIITPRIEGINAGMFVDSKAMPKRFFQFNATLTQLYWAAYSNFNPRIRYNLIEIDSKDSLKFFWPVKDKLYLLERSKYNNRAECAKDNTFCYELSLDNPVRDTTFTSYMFNDLNRFFNVNATTEFKNIPCWIVDVSDDFELKVNSLDTTNKSTSINFSNGRLIIHNSSVDELMNFISSKYQQVTEPFVYETPSTKDLRINLEIDFSNDLEFRQNNVFSLKFLFARLKELGIDLEKGIRPHKILVLRDI